MNYTHQIHNIDPVWNENSEILILGSFPSVASRETNFFYGHKTNRFWKVLAKIYSLEEPKTIVEKKNFLLENKIAIWDVIKSCDIIGSADSSIKNVEINDIKMIINQSKIKQIYVNGNKALALYQKYVEPITNMKAIALPSTSPANAAYSLEKLFNIWFKLIINRDNV